MFHFIARHFHLIHIPPLLPIVICFMAGIIWHSALPVICVAFACILCCTLFAHYKQIAFPKHIILYAFFALCGVLFYQKELRDYDNFYNTFGNKKITVTGTIIDSNETAVNHQKTTVLTLAIDTIATFSYSEKSNKTMLFYGKSNKTIVVGDTITIFDFCCKKPSNQHFQCYQIKEQVVATIFNDSLNYQIDYHPQWSLRHWVWSHKKRILDCLQDKLSSTNFSFFSSLFLGNRLHVKESLENVNDQFKSWGIFHFLARSGLHLVVFLMIWQMLFSVIPLPFGIKQFLLTLIAFLYCLFSWTSTPFTRSFALFILGKICLINKKSFHLIHYLTLVCFGFLLYSPLYIFFLDFQLSFALTFALAWFNQVATQQKNALLKY